MRSNLPILAACCIAIAGCASAPPPAELDLARTRIVVAAEAPKLDVSSLPGGKGAGASVGAASGSGWGALAGGAACLATGPFVVACLAVVLPTTTGVGLLTGAAVGAARTETVGAVELKTRALAAELQATSFSAQMASRLREQLQNALTVDVPLAGPAGDGVDLLADPDHAPAERPWTLEVGVREIGAEGNSEFGLRFVAVARLRHAGGAPVWQATREVQSETELNLGQWLGNEASLLHEVADVCLKKAAAQLANELGRAHPGNGASRPSSRRSTSCDDHLPKSPPTVAAAS